MAFPVDFNPSNTADLSALFRARPLDGGLAVIFSGGRRSDRYFAAWLLAGELRLPLVQSQVPVANSVAFIDWKVDAGDDTGKPPQTSFGVSVEVSDEGVEVSGHAGTAVPGGQVSTEGNAGVDLESGEVHAGGSAEVNLFGVGVKVSANTETGPDGPSVGGGAEVSLPIQPLRMNVPFNPFGPGPQSPLAAIGTPPGSVIVYSLDEPVVLFEVIADVVVHFSAEGREDIAPPAGASGPPNAISATNTFHVQIDRRAAGFSEVSAVASETIGSRGTVYPNLVLRRALTSDRELYRWRANIAAGQADVRSLAIHQLSPAGEIIGSWWIEGAWPVRWRGPSWNALASEPAMEEVELCISRMEWR